MTLIIVSGQGFYICRKPGKGVLTITAVCSKLINSQQIILINSSTVNKSYQQFSLQSGIKLQNVFVQISKSICPNCKMCLFKFQKVFVKIAKCICSNFKMYLSNCKMYLFKFQKVFVRIAKCICPNFGMYLSKLHKVFVKIAKCWQLTPFTKYNY